jgi:putative restriction endonuclease
VTGVTRDELLGALAGLRKANVGGRRAPHKPLLLLWLLGRLAEGGSTLATYREAAEPVSRLINDYGPTVARPGAAGDRAAMPFVHLERTLWDLRDGTGTPIGPDARESGPRLRRAEAVGRLRPEVEQLLSDAGTLATAVRLLLEQHFTTSLEVAICEQAGLDLAELEVSLLESALNGGRYRPRRRTRRSGFAEEVLGAYAYACAMCGYDGALGRNPVGLEAAHVRWHSQDGPDEVSNALALCSLHHRLFDLGVLGLTEDRTVRVSDLYVSRSRAGAAVTALHGATVTRPRRAGAGG